MTEEEDNQCYDVIEALRLALKAVVNAATATLNEAQGQQVREILGETHRFWAD